MTIYLYTKLLHFVYVACMSEPGTNESLKKVHLYKATYFIHYHGLFLTL